MRLEDRARAVVASCLAVLLAALPLASARPAGAAVPAVAIAAGKEAGKLIAEKVFKAMASNLYNDECTRTDHDVLSLICGALGDFSGDKEKEWKENVASQLNAIREDLAALAQGQLQIRRQLDDILRQNQLLLAEIKAIVTETTAQLPLSELQTLWRRYERLFASTESFNRRDLLSFARDLVTTQNLHTKLGVLSNTITSGGIGGKEPLLQLYANKLQVQLETGAEAGLVSAYQYLETVVSDLLFEQRRGFLMYVWAAEILEGECELRQGTADPCRDGDWPPIRAVRFEPGFYEDVGEQLDAFNSAVEWLILANSDPHSASADFLHPDAAALFWRADLFTAANLGESGLRGRVISTAGSPFDGALKLRDRTLRSYRQSDVAAIHGAVDWWRATKQARVYDELHLTNAWRIHRYRDPGATELGSWGIDTALPFKPARVSVTLVDLLEGSVVFDPSSDTAVPFGSFVALERAGGGYALMSGSWEALHPRPDHGFESTVPRRSAFRDSYWKSVAEHAPLRAGVEVRGRVEYSDRGKLWDRQAFETAYWASVATDKQIRFPRGGELTLNVAPASGLFTGEDGYGYETDWADTLAAVGLKTDYQSGGIDPRPARFQGRVALVFGDADSTNGLVKEVRFTTGTPEARIEKWTYDGESATVRLKKGQSYPLTLHVRVQVYQEPKGLNATNVKALAKGWFRNVFLTAPP